MPFSTPPTILDTVTSTTNAGSVTSNTLSPSGNALLAVVASGSNSSSGALMTPTSISDTFAEELSWTKFEANRGSGLGVGIVIFLAQVSASPGTGTVTVTYANNVSNKVLISMEMEGQDLSGAVVQGKEAGTSNTSPFVITFDAAPDPTSMVLAAMATRGSTGPYTFTPGSDFSELAEEQPSTGHGLQIQYDLEDADSTTDWTGSFGGNGIAGIAVEIASASSEETMSGTTGGLATVSATAKAVVYVQGTAAGAATAEATLSGSSGIVEIVLQPTAATASDTQIFQGSPNNNFGISAELSAGANAAAQVYKSMIKFDLSSLPAGVTVIAATLTLYCYFEFSATDQNVSAHRALTNWVEGSELDANDIAKSGSSWNFRDKLTSATWSGGAGGGSGSDYASSPTDTTSITGSGAYFDWDVLADVEDWVAGSATNYGWWLIGPSTANSSKIFAASDFTGTTIPKLTIQFIYPTQLASGFADGAATASAHIIGRVRGQGSAAGSSTAVAASHNPAIAKTNTFENALLRLIFNATPIAGLADDATSSPLTNLYVSLHTGAVGEDGTQETNEVSYSGYTRVAVPRDETGWTVADGAAENAIPVVFSEVVGGSDVITHIAIGTDSTGEGRVLYSHELVDPYTVVIAAIPQISAGSLRVYED